MVEVRQLQGTGQVEASIELLRELIGRGERSGEILFRYGRALAAKGYPGQAVWALDAAMDDPDWLVPASHQLAMDAARSENFDLALNVLDRLRNERADSHDEDLRARLLETRVLLKSRRAYEEALDLIEPILDDFPDDEEAIRLKAVALLGLKQTDEAYDLIREAGIPAADVGAEGQAEGEQALDLDLASDSHEAYWCTVRASFKREAGEPQEALQIIDECLEKFPTSVDLMNEASSIYGQLGQFDRILEMLRGAYDEDPKGRATRNSLVQHLRAIGMEKEAESTLRQALDDRGNDEMSSPFEVAGVWVDLGGYLIEQGRTEEGIDAFDEALAILGDQVSPDFLFRHAEALILVGRYDEAVAIADQTPIEVHRPMIRGRVAFERGEYAEAIEELDRAALIWPDNAPTRYYLARAAEGVGDFDRAIEDYRQAIRSDPTLAAARQRLIRLHLAEGRVRDASTIHYFTSALVKSQPSMELRLLAIEIEARLGRAPDLSIAPEGDISLLELHRRAVKSLGRGLYRRSGATVAQETLEELGGAVERRIKGFFYREQVEVLLGANENLDEAVSIAREALKELPGHVDLTLALGRALAQAGVDLDEAERSLRMVLESYPEEADAIAAIGDLAARRGDDGAAIEAYDEALAFVPDHWQALLGRTDALIRGGREEEALSALRTYVDRLNPYDGRAALYLARRLGGEDATRDQRIALARRAIRFGAGKDALDFLISLDPAAGAEYGIRPADPALVPTEPPQQSS